MLAIPGGGRQLGQGAPPPTARLRVSGGATHFHAGAGMTTDGDPESTAPERRVNPALRKLVDQMLAQVRIAARRDEWSAEERERAEADLDRIMATVRQSAVAGADGSQPT